MAPDFLLERPPQRPSNSQRACANKRNAEGWIGQPVHPQRPGRQ